MGDLIVLAERLADRARTTPGGAMVAEEAFGGEGAAPDVHDRPAFFFDLACPFSYLTAEQVERTLGEVDWIPVPRSALPHAALSARVARSHRLAERRAAELRLPLVWPDSRLGGTPSALRAAAYAADIGAGTEFALAASRLAFCGGFNLEDPEILAEAAAAAAVPLDDCLAAAGDPSWNDDLRATAYALAAHGITELPAIRIAGRHVQGEAVLAEAAALLRSRRVERRPVAPVS